MGALEAARRALLAALVSQANSEFLNCVVGALVSSNQEIRISVPAGALSKAAPEPSKRVQPIVRGRAAVDLLLEAPPACTALGNCKKMVALPYGQLLMHGTLEELLLLAHKVDLRLFVGRSAPGASAQQL